MTHISAETTPQVTGGILKKESHPIYILNIMVVPRESDFFPNLQRPHSPSVGGLVSPSSSGLLPEAWEPEGPVPDLSWS